MADRFGYGEIGLDIHPCRGCEDYDAPDGCKSNGGCGKPVTNADHIRGMTDEELAELLWDVESSDVDGFGDYDPHKVIDWRWFRYPSELLDWLKSPVEVDNG